MKYPQLVSSRAVNEISDWLIKRLEELDIEHPCVYSRLLLSLLHTPFKLNALDLDEIPQLKDLKQPYHLLSKDNEELKRIAAVQSLMEVSSVDQNKANIVNLVDELHSKLRKIENGEETSLIASNNRNQHNSLEVSDKQKYYKNIKKIKRNHVTQSIENPSKNYYLAFPALSHQDKIEQKNFGKESSKLSMSSSKKSSDEKTICWSNLISANNQHHNEIQSSKSKSHYERSAEIGFKTNFPMNPAKRAPKSNRFHYNKNDIHQQFQISKNSSAANNSFDNTFLNFGQKKQVVKKKQKHQRNNFVFPKNNKTYVNIKDQGKLIDKDFTTISSSTKSVIRTREATTVTSSYSNFNLGNSQKHFNRQKNVLTASSSSLAAPWDMDFNGQWEMERDLISEFIKNENGQDRIDKNLEKQDIFYSLSEEENIVIKCLPVELIEDSSLSFVVEKPDDIDDIFNKRANYQFEEWEETLDEASNHNEYERPINIKEVQTLNLFKSKFDDNVKALWDNNIINPVPIPAVDLAKNSNNDCLSQEMNSLSLFNWNHYHKPFQSKNENDKFYYLNVIDFDKNNNIGTSRSTSNNSIAESKFIKSGTNLQHSIWSDSDVKADSDESYSSKELHQIFYNSEYNNNNDFSKNGQEQETQSVVPSVILIEENDTNDVERPFTPLNKFSHSNSSCFEVYTPTAIKPPSLSNKTQTVQSEEPIIADSPVPNGEDLLTSEKTHFYPIKHTYNDGHTFAIDCRLDSVTFIRSETGNLYLDDKKYMKYKGGMRKYVLSHDTSDPEDSYYEEWDKKPGKICSERNFIIKFCCIEENNKYCQTENLQPVKNYSSFTDAAKDFYNYYNYQKYLTNDSAKWINPKSTDYSCYTSTTCNENGPESGLQTNNYLFLSSNSSSSSISTIMSLEQPHSLSMDIWRPKIDEHNVVDVCNQTGHSLWEHCSSCHNKDIENGQSQTADRLMRDELKMDGDEIMSDLKYIQNLYITAGDNYEDQDTIDEYLNEISDEREDGEVGEDPENENLYYEQFYGAKKKYIFDPYAGDSETAGKLFSKIRNTVNEEHPNFQKYLKIFQLINASLLKEKDTNNNTMSERSHTERYSEDNYDLRKMENNRKRRHSTCQQMLEKKYLVHPSIPMYKGEHNTYLYHPSDCWDIGIMYKCDEKQDSRVDLIPTTIGLEYSKNILQQHAIIKYLDLARPLTR